MKQWLGSSIHRYTLFVSLLPAVLVAFVLTGAATVAMAILATLLSAVSPENPAITKEPAGAFSHVVTDGL